MPIEICPRLDLSAEEAERNCELGLDVMDVVGYWNTFLCLNSSVLNHVLQTLFSGSLGTVHISLSKKLSGFSIPSSYLSLDTRTTNQ